MRHRYSSLSRHSERDRGIDVNPMLDIVFILLIFFIVTAVFVRERGIDMSPSDNANPPDPDPEHRAIIVRIDAGDTITIEQRYVDVRRVSAHLTRLHAERPKAGVVIDAHPNSSTNVLVQVMDQSRSVGIYNISFAKG